VPVAVPAASEGFNNGTAPWGRTAFPVLERHVLGIECWLAGRTQRSRAPHWARRQCRQQSRAVKESRSSRRNPGPDTEWVLARTEDV